MINNYTFSIITPTLNSEKTIVRCLKSVAMQKNVNFQQIIIDGGSIDETLKICKNFRYTNNILIKDGQIKGIYKSINEGIKASWGKFVILLNSDDWFYDKNTLSKIKKKIESNKDNKKIFIFKSKIYDGKKFVGQINYNTNFNIPLQSLPFSHGAMVVKRNFFNNNFFYDENYSLSSDLDFVNKIKKKDMCFIDLVIHCFSSRGTSSLSFNGIFESRKIAIKYGKNSLLSNIYFIKSIINKLLIKFFGIGNIIYLRSKFYKKSIWH